MIVVTIDYGKQRGELIARLPSRKVAFFAPHPMAQAGESWAAELIEERERFARVRLVEKTIHRSTVGYRLDEIEGRLQKVLRESWVCNRGDAVRMITELDGQAVEYDAWRRPRRVYGDAAKAIADALVVARGEEPLAPGYEPVRWVLYYEEPQPAKMDGVWNIVHRAGDKLSAESLTGGAQHEAGNLLIPRGKVVSTRLAHVAKFGQHSWEEFDPSESQDGKYRDGTVIAKVTVARVALEHPLVVHTPDWYFDIGFWHCKGFLPGEYDIALWDTAERIAVRTFAHRNDDSGAYVSFED